VISAARVGQEGLLAALPEFEEHVRKVRISLLERRDRLVTGLRSAHIDGFLDPAGSLFVFLYLPGVRDSLTFCHRLLEEQHVVAVPGSAFGPDAGGAIRLSFGSTPADSLEKAALRIGAFSEDFAADD
jgi:aspartate aminotransferase/aminotransferase